MGTLWSVASSNRAVRLIDQGRHEEAIKILRQSLRLVPDEAATHHNMSLALCHTDLVAAREYELEAIRLSQDVGSRRSYLAGLALIEMASGEYATGLRRFAENVDRSHYGSHFLDMPTWSGEDLSEKRLVVFADQGMGDFILWCRFLRGIAREVMFAVPTPLVRLMERHDSPCDLVHDLNTPVIDADCQILMMDAVSRVFDVSALVDAPPPYLWRSVAHQRTCDSFRVGLCWASTSTCVDRDRKSMRYSDMAPLFDLPGAAYQSLQHGLDPESDHVAPLPTGVYDLEGVAGSVNACDLVVTVDTAVAHLAGAMGVPTAVLLPHDSYLVWGAPFYPATTLFRQRTMWDWTGPVNEVRELIARLAVS